jgi:mono/diheme cytochrome c family protein
MPTRLSCAALIVLLAGAGRAPAAAPPTGAEPARFFETRVRPILQAHCLQCHDSAKARGGLSLTSREALLQGGTRGPAVSPGRPGDSLLLQAVSHRDLKMPPKGKLSPAQIDTLERWVKMGAPWSKAASVARSGPPPVDAQARQFWSFRPVVRPGVPAVKRADWARTPIDAFILARLEAAGLKPAPAAAPESLLRRV